MQLKLFLIFTIDYETFSTINNAAYSLLAVMKRIYNWEEKITKSEFEDN